MKLTKLQNDRIEQIIKDEMKFLKEGWHKAGRLHDSSRRNQRRLFEASALESDLSDSSIESALEQSTLDSGQACVVEFDQEVLNHVLSVLKSHGLVDSGANAATLSENLEDFSGDDLIMAQQEAAADISMALSKYAKEVAQMATMMYSGGDE